METGNKLTLRFDPETLEFTKPLESSIFFGSNESLLDGFLNELMDRCENFENIKNYQRFGKLLVAIFVLHMIFSFALFLSCVILRYWSLLLVTISFVLVGLAALLFLLLVKNTMFYRKLNYYAAIIQDLINNYNNDKFFHLDLEAFFYCYSENQNIEDNEGANNNDNWRLFIRPSVAEDNKLRALVMNIDIYRSNFSLISSCNSSFNNHICQVSKSSMERTDISAIMQYV
jgi:hypothetical protein